SGMRDRPAVRKIPMGRGRTTGESGGTRQFLPQHDGQVQPGNGSQRVDRESPGVLAKGATNRKSRFRPERTSKASSAESILRHCLRALGFTKRWKQGKLTNRQVLKLLKEVRQYGRAWLRHEANEFVYSYLPEADRG